MPLLKSFNFFLACGLYEGPRMPMLDLSETELMSRVLARRPGAWRELEARYRRIVYRCIIMTLNRCTIGASNADIDEVYAELQLSLLQDDMRKLRLWDPARGASLGSWLGLLAKNAARDFVRARGSAKETDTEQLAELSSPDGSPLDAVLADERRARLSDTLAAYTERDRRFLALYFGQGLSVEEMAAAMGISEKTVYTKKHKLLHRLAGEMAAA